MITPTYTHESTAGAPTCTPAMFNYMLRYVAPNMQPDDKICCNENCNQGRNCPLRNAKPH